MVAPFISLTFPWLRFTINYTHSSFSFSFPQQKALILRNKAVCDRKRCLLYDAVSRNLARFRYKELVTNLGKTLLSTAKASLCHREAGWRGKESARGQPARYSAALLLFSFIQFVL